MSLWRDGAIAAIAATRFDSNGHLSLWHLCVVGAVEGVVEAAHWLA
ncbi:hypothetical protein [Microtetraspora malaysiensis]|uniref:Uncharacterized protein n=1 Tax=Microtetraspora malaysiensis TaxID=161358 RepID=A0ABW6T6D0_9ACTN